MEQKQIELINVEWLYDFWKYWVTWLPQKEGIFQVADFDYTIFSRDEQMKSESIFREKRWDEAPKFFFKERGMQNYIETYFQNRSFPKDIIQKLDSSRDIIITAWMYEWQLAKIRTLKELNNFRVINTSNWSEKIVELIRYILFELRYIPSEIIVYEDRPQYFVEYRELIEEVLGTKLTVMYVEMDGNNGYKKIEAI